VTLDARYLRPWRLLPNRVNRFYRGGRLIDEFRGRSGAADTDEPEDWVGSATRAWTPPGSPPSDVGLGDASIAGERFRVADVLATDPAAVVGEKLVAVAGATPGVLVKLLDAGERLPIHCHPDRDFARRHLDSFFGKAEAWVVVGTRVLPGGPPPGVWIGFDRDIDRDGLIRGIEAEESEGLLASMLWRPTIAGDVWFIPPGTPHAIGAGVFIVEIQEPTDFSIVAESAGGRVDPMDAHLHLGWDVSIDAFDRSGHEDPWLDDLHPPPTIAGEGLGWTRRSLLGEAARPFFRADRVEIHGTVERPWAEDAWLIGAVLRGAGTVHANESDLDVTRGDAFAVPAAILQGLRVTSDGDMEFLACRPPDPVDLHTDLP
jgi:mannose-6-phosphate isomerase